MIHSYLSELSETGLSSISTDRKKQLLILVEYLRDTLSQDGKAALNFICTHNSRRSHLTQIWAQTVASHFGFTNITCYSGGTEATAMYPSVQHTLAEKGFDISILQNGTNPIYAIRYDSIQSPIIAFSKTFDHSFNPKETFAAVMTCNHADANCPYIPGAKRISLPYKDPKEFDGTEKELEKYQERSEQIATEMIFVFKSLQEQK